MLEGRTVESKVLNMARRYSVYLPAGYATDERSYPVLYLLHGKGDDDSGWIQFGEVKRIADEAMARGIATPMVIVMPDANTGQLGYFNDLRGQWRYEDFFFTELIPHIEKSYRVRTDRRYRAVAGLSMGGGGTMIYALRHPEMFCCACPLSAYLGPMSYEQFLANDGHGIVRVERPEELSEERLKNYYAAHNPCEMVRSMNDGALKVLRRVDWYIDCGDDDTRSPDNSRFHILLCEKNIPHEYRVRDGGHNWTYWREALPEVLRFCSDRFHQR